jgi:hypothetical protein
MAARVVPSGERVQQAPPAAGQPYSSETTSPSVREGKLRWVFAFLILFLSAPSATADNWSDARWNIEYNQMDELAQVLDQKRLDVNASGPDGWTLLMVAAWKDKPEFVSFLLDRGADPSAENSNGEKAVDLTTSAAVSAMLGGKKTAPKMPGSTVDLAYCKKLGGQAYLLCGAGDSTCRMQALNEQQQCEATGVWP